MVFTDVVTWCCEDYATKLGVPPVVDHFTHISSISRKIAFRK